MILYQYFRLQIVEIKFLDSTEQQMRIGSKIKIFIKSENTSIIRKSQ
jgi:hypothetical protein